MKVIEVVAGSERLRVERLKGGAKLYADASMLDAFVPEEAIEAEPYRLRISEEEIAEAENIDYPTVVEPVEKPLASSLSQLEVFDRVCMKLDSSKRLSRN